ncbi:YitT family protein [Ideonella paludis]|uniref:YitT family protein n=1 Tax=Ideonella paludis TaxID=1233411 RepID=A0ABS5E083_9BURK|nr:YitT family protein [Ideonella paludis]MBQ0936818.1 YitT family protein [Ideonella paludis]
MSGSGSLGRAVSGTIGKLVPQRHSLLDDAQAIVTGTLFVALGLLLFKQAGLMTGGIVGLAFLTHYATGWTFGAVFFALNLPFYILAWQRMGARFTLKTMAAVTLLSVGSQGLPQVLTLQSVNPVFAAIAGGLLVGAGFVVLFRHKASLGGLNVLVMWLQERFGWSAGKLQMGIDAVILLASWPLMDAQRLALSILAAAAMNFALAVNHKPGRYVAF